MIVLRLFKHTGVVILGVFLVLGIPFLTTDYFKSYITSGGVDTVSSASTILDQPSGRYVILVNGALHTDEEKLADWITFFSGGEITYIFEDISCTVASGDTGALDMAKSFQSRLPENQMTIQTEDSTLVLSRADYGKFDILIMSAEFVEANASTFAYADEIFVIEIEGES